MTLQCQRATTMMGRSEKVEIFKKEDFKRLTTVQRSEELEFGIRSSEAQILRKLNCLDGEEDC